MGRHEGNDWTRAFKRLEKQDDYAKNATVAQVAIAWVLSRGTDVVPLVGARRRDRLAEALGALRLTLGTSDLEQIEHAVPAGAAAGSRYAAAQMATLDSEKKT